ncbi:MAG: DUF4124 domain-containing protein [Steroidobacteraceae bacterium]
MHSAPQRFSVLRPLRAALLAAVAAVAFAGVALVPAPARAADGPKVYRWVDDKGVVHYGDRIPPQYAQQDSTVLNDQGVEVGHVAAPRTPAELAEAARTQKRQLAQKQRDTFLLTTYTSVKDIEQLRDERLEQLKGQQAAAAQYIATLHERLLALQARAMLFKPYNSEPRAHRMPDDLAEQIVRTLDEERSQRTALATKDQQQATMRAQFQADIDRYLELRTSGTPGSH